MDFYSRQAAARRQTRGLVAAFLLAVVLVVVSLDMVLFTLLASGEADSPTFAPLDYAARNPGAASVCTLIILGVIGLASCYKSFQLRSGGGVVAQALGGARVEHDVGDPSRRRLRNVVEEMAIASGVPVPEIYVLEQEAGINAFAAGHTPANAAVAVTQGALDRLSREQLQGVIAHEFSHVVNGDMRLNVQMLGWLFGLFVVALIGRTLLRLAPRGGRKGGGAVLVTALAVMIMGYLGLLAGRILQAAVSRQRERLADASAVQFTRNPGGLKEALLKIAGLSAGSRLQAPAAEEVAHMLFAPGLKRLFATHPPLSERIRALDPSFDVDSLPRLAAEASRDGDEVQAPLEAQPIVASLTRREGARGAVVADPRRIADQVGQLDRVSIEFARDLRFALSNTLKEKTASPAGARAFVLALLLSRNPPVRNRQLTRLANDLDRIALSRLRECLPVVDGLDPMLRLPALLHAFPVLRRLPVLERQGLCASSEELILADAQVDVFEFCLSKLLETLLRDELGARAPHGSLAFQDVVVELQIVFSTLAQVGVVDERQARAAYEAGTNALHLQARAGYMALGDWPRRLGPALTRLEQLQSQSKRQLIEGLVCTVAHDEVLTVAEAELLRTVCAILHCPMPPLLPSVPSGGSQHPLVKG